MMAEQPKSVEIELNAFGFGQIWVDGGEIHHVRSVVIETNARELTRVELRLSPINGIKFKGPGHVVKINECALCGQAVPPSPGEEETNSVKTDG